MEALGGLAVAERDIRALSTARVDRGRSGDSARYARRDPASPFQSARGHNLWSRPPNVPRRDGLCDIRSPGGL